MVGMAQSSSSLLSFDSSVSLGYIIKEFKNSSSYTVQCTPQTS